METPHQPEDIVAQRYRIVTCLGRGGMGTTYEAEDLTNYKRVAIKVLSLGNITEWKILELFEREAKVLSNLNHPAIPKYFDYFQVDNPDDRRFYLVRELVSGDSLADLVQKGWHPDEKQVKQIAIQLLQILKYLHALTPPVIHRDIKPQNIIQRSDGRVFLVDFGSVQDVYRNTLTRSGTFVGTLGYISPEQFRGQVVPASDLYSLGATLLFLLTHKLPDEFPLKRMKIDFRSQAKISDELADWLDKMLEPTVEKRFDSVRFALEILQENSSIAPIHPQPEGSHIILKRSYRNLIVHIPSKALRTRLWDLASFAGCWFGFLSFSMLIAFNTFMDSISFWSTPLPYIGFFWFIGLFLLPPIMFALFGRIHLEIDRKTFRLQWKWLGFSRQVQGKTADIKRVQLSKPNMVHLQGTFACTLVENDKAHQFGSGMKPANQEWLLAEIADFLKEIQS